MFHWLIKNANGKVWIGIEFLHEKLTFNKQTYLKVVMDRKSFLFNLFKVYVINRRSPGLRVCDIDNFIKFEYVSVCWV